VTHLRAARLEEAAASFDQAREILEKICDQRVEGAGYIGHLAQVCRHLGMAQRRAGRPEQAMTFYESALKLQERLAREQPTDPWIRSNLAALHYNIGNLRRETGQSGVIESYERANEIFEPLVREYRSIAEFRMQYAQCLGNLATVTHSTRSISAYARVADLQREGVELHPSVVSFRFDLAMALFHLARDYLFVDQPQEALRHAQEGTERLEALLVNDKDPLGQARSLLGMLWEERAEALVALGCEPEAVEALQVAIRHQGKALEQDPRSDDYKEELLNHAYHLTALRCIMGQTQEAVSSLEAMEPLLPAKPGKLFVDARNLALGWSKATSAAGGRTKRTRTATQLYGALVVKMLERSVQAGFRDFPQLINDPAFEPFRTRDVFQRLLVRMMGLASPSDVFAR